MKTLNKAVARYNGISLIVRILIGLIIGAVLALVAPGAGWVGELGSLFVGALKGIAPVLVFVIVASALARGAAGSGRSHGHSAHQLCGKPRQRHHERQLHRHPVLGLHVRRGHEEDRL